MTSSSIVLKISKSPANRVKLKPTRNKGKVKKIRQIKNRPSNISQIKGKIKSIRNKGKVKKIRQIKDKASKINQTKGKVKFNKIRQTKGKVKLIKTSRKVKPRPSHSKDTPMPITLR